jgi:hypothetical protein
MFGKPSLEVTGTVGSLPNVDVTLGNNKMTTIITLNGSSPTEHGCLIKQEAYIRWDIL